MTEPIEGYIARSSIGDSAWIDCPVHGHEARDPDTDECVWCAAERADS